MKLTIVNQSGQAVPQQFIIKWTRALEKQAAVLISPRRFAAKELTLAFLTEAAARALNLEFRRKNYATDILSFPGEAASLGELVICPSVISRQAKEHGLLVREELGYMLIHGFLHLLGYDHEQDERSAKRMFALQDRIFTELLRKKIRG